MNQPMIRFNQVFKRYRKKVVLDGLDVQVDAGRTTVLLGENGAGKTTVVRLLCGLARPAAGTILVDGVPPEDAKPALGVLFEDPQVYPHLDGWTNLELLAGQIAVSDAERGAILSMLGLDNMLLQRRGRGYSFGQKRRLTLAAVLCRNPKIFVLDEPTNGLDPDGVEAFLAVMQTARQQGKTLLVTGQDLTAFDSLADDVLILADGRIAEIRDWPSFRRRLPSVLFVRAMPIDRVRQDLSSQDAARLQCTWLADAVRITGDHTSLQRLAAELTSRRDVDVQELRFEQPTLLDVYRLRMGGSLDHGNS